MAGQYESLNEKAKLIDISLKYTNGDLDKAKSMASGQYLDSVAVKAKFYNTENGMSGLVLAFFNYVDEYIASVNSVINSDVSLFEKVRIFEDWKGIFHHINSFSSGKNTVEISGFNDHLLDSFIRLDLFPYVRDKDLEEVTNRMHSALQEILGSEKIQCQVEMDHTSSLAMEMAGVVIETPDAGRPETAEQAGDAGIDVIEDERITKIENEADYVLEGKAIVAPVKGKYINDISAGEKIKVMLTANDVITDKVLKALNAFDETGGRFPVNGRIKAKIPMDKSGYILYALVAKGILVKIIEEENVKILVDKLVEETVKEDKKDSKIVYIMAIAVGLIIITGIILLVLL